MRLTKELLLRFAKTHATERLLQRPHPICIYLTGSLCTDDFLLGGCTDIDLIFVHNICPSVERELIAVTPDVALDIRHYDVSVFEQPRQLRNNAWIGSFLCENPLVLHDSRHWFEFTQASVCAQFFRPENALLRSQPFLDSARQLWMECISGTHKPGAFTLRSYLRSIYAGANALACLLGIPLAERRAFSQFAQYAQTAEKPSLTGQLVELLTSPLVNDEAWQFMQKNWLDAMQQAGKQENCPVELSSLRHAYLLQAAQAIWNTTPAGAVWQMLQYWTEAMVYLPADAARIKLWEEACKLLNLMPENYAKRFSQLDQFLEEIESYFDLFKLKNSINTD